MKTPYTGLGALPGLAAGVLLALTASAASAHNLDRANPAARWATSAERRLDAHLEYPAAAAVQDTRAAEVTVIVAADGRLGTPVVRRSTGVPALDEAAVDAVRRARTVAAPPAALVDRAITWRATFAVPETRLGR